MSHAVDTTIEPVFEPKGQTYGVVTDRITNITLRPPGHAWLALVGLGMSGMLFLGMGVLWLLYLGVGVWGVNIPVGWGVAIVHFVWWIGIGHAGTFISAILLLLRQTWRNSINRFAEAMTLFAVAQAGMFPLLHLGRVQRFFYLFPYPSTTGTWPNWRSPLVWDVFAVSTYATVSLLFWYVGLIPDLATLRDTAKNKIVRIISGTFAAGWRGEARQWQRHQVLSLLLAGLCTPLVLSVHSIVSFDFSIAIVPGWHSTIFPPYFVAGAIFGGFAMVATLAIPVRRIYGLQDMITIKHFDNMAKITLLTGLIVAYGYAMEMFTPFFSGEKYEIAMTMNRMHGPYCLIFWATITCNCIIPQLLWSRSIRRNTITFFIVCQFITLGMWLERFMIVEISLHRDYMPSAWGMYYPTFWDWSVYFGTIAFFFTLVMLFIKFVPMIPIYEMKELMHHQHDVPLEPRDERELQTDIPAYLELAPEDVYGMVAEFETSEHLEEAAKVAAEAGYTKLSAYSPLPLADLPEAMKARRTRIPALVLAGGIFGAVGGFGLQYWCAVIDYPWNIGGRPYFSWPAFIPITFECTILGASMVGLIMLFVRNRFPQLYHPVSNTPNFDRATRDRFFLAVERKGNDYNRDKIESMLKDLSPIRVTEVPR